MLGMFTGRAMIEIIEITKRAPARILIFPPGCPRSVGIDMTEYPDSGIAVAILPLEEQDDDRTSETAATRTITYTDEGNIFRLVRH